MQNSSQTHPEHVPPIRAWYKRPVILSIPLVVLIISLSAGLAIWYKTDSKTKSSAAQTTTLYYSDGKTLLWQTGQDLGPNADFISYVQDQLKVKYGSDYQLKGTWKITTSLDKGLQDAALQKIREQKPTRQAHGVTNGRVVSWASEKEPNTPDPVRQKLLVGTLAIPFTYMAYVDKNSASSTSAVFDDSQRPLSGYPCTDRSREGNCLQNYDRQYLGKLHLGQALGGLRNVAAVSTGMEFGSSKIHDLAATMGSDGQCYSDAALTQTANCYSGALFGEGLYVTPQRVVQAYATLANKGSKLPQTVIVQTSLNDAAQEQSSANATRALNQNTAQTITDVLSDPRLSFLSDNYKSVFTSNGKKVAFVGGFTNDAKLSSTILYNEKYAIGVWGYAKQPLVGAATPKAIAPHASAWLDATSAN